MTAESETRSRASGQDIRGESSQSISPPEVAKAIKGVHFPSRPQQLAEAADRNHARDEVKSFLRNLEDREYQSPVDIEKELSAAKGNR
jgi:predicted transcriptional regulator